MSKKEIRRINTVPDWIRETIAGFSVNAEMSEPISLYNAAKGKNDDIVVTLDIVASPSESGAGDVATVRIKWADSIDDTGPGIEYEKSYSALEQGEVAARKDYTDRIADLKKLEASSTGGAQEQSQTAVKEYLERLDSERDKSHADPHQTGLRGNSQLKVLAELGGVKIIQNAQKIAVDVSDDFLKIALNKYKPVEGHPTNNPEVTYTTSSRPHCGASNFIVSYWGKLNTSDGNIVRRAMLVDRIGNGTKFLVAGVSTEEYNHLCAFLTPDSSQYGIEYDSHTEQWTLSKEAVVQKQVEFDLSKPEEKEEFQRLNPTPEAKSEGEGGIPDLEPLAGEDKDKGEPTGEEGEDQSVAFEGGAGQSEALPEGGLPDLPPLK